MQRGKGKIDDQATFVVFDILYLDGKSLLNEPLYVRKKILEKVVEESGCLQTSVYTKNGKKLWAFVEKEQLEGVIAKEYDSSYELNARSEAWRKIKLSQEIDCVVLGFTSEKRQLTSLALGLHIDGELQFVGKAGTGFDDKTMRLLRKQLDGLRADAAVDLEADIIPVAPLMVVQVSYHMVTKNNKLRAPVFVRLREDKDPDECVL